MTDFADKGFAVIDLIQPRFAADLWRDIDKEEIRKLLLDTDSDAHWKTLENFPRKRSLITFTREVDSVSYHSLLESSCVLIIE